EREQQDNKGLKATKSTKGSDSSTQNQAQIATSELPGSAAQSSTNKENKPRRRSFKETRELEFLDQNIPLLEAKRAELEASLAKGDNDLTLLSQELANLIETLHNNEERWLELSELTP
ncbi:MAG: ABC transporter C-terminal domain-containing protein, partial [Prochlorococcus sp.]|nr:ABC transporter C-terminal domain-containing protein [Prochlorococcaceae cyanobacterium ETNP18_MAG_1]